MSTPTGSETFRAALEALVARGATRADRTSWDAEGEERQLELKVRAQLQQLLEGPVEIQLLFVLLAGARRPHVGPFVDPLRQRLGDTQLEAETLDALRRGLASPDELVCINALTLLRCAPAQIHRLEAEITAQLTNVETDVRIQAADTLRVCPALTPPSMKALHWLAVRNSKGWDGSAARDALAQHGSPVPLPPGGIDARTLVRGVLPLPITMGSPQLLGEDGLLYFAFTPSWWARVPPTPEQGWHPTRGQAGLARLRLTAEGPRLELFQAPVATPAGWSLAARLGQEFLCVLSSTLSKDWRNNTAHFFLFFHPATRTWSQGLPEQGVPGPRIPLDERLEDPSRGVVGGKHYVVWHEPSGVKACNDDTNYGTLDYHRESWVKDAYMSQSGAHRQATSAHTLSMMSRFGGADPWVLSTPPSAEEHLFHLHKAFFEHHPYLKPEDVSALQWKSAHQLRDESGHLQRVLFLEAWLHEPGRYESAALVLSPSEKPAPKQEEPITRRPAKIDPWV